MEEQKQDSHCENSDSDDNSDVVNTNHSRPLPSHNDALQCVSQLITYSSAHHPQFIGYFFACTAVLSGNGLQLRCQQDRQKSMNIFHQMNEIIVAEFQIT
jgi:hypothetical protein